ncbi:MAG: radical SAM protein [Candidatus Saganbacteria bacterium]|nr:radical SAM protein [Candidatus Saganbacteria bacterium]
MEYTQSKKYEKIPRLPFEAKVDLTYRCNNNCRHCWLRIPADSEEKKRELSFEKIKDIICQARKLGCRRWSISGGEPMLRPDFEEIFDYITSHSMSYSLNSNGTLITPMIAKLMKKRGTKMIAVYGATAEVHDHITRNPGSFDALMRGFAYLKEAGAGFIVQLIPMKDNYHQFDQMVKLAKSLSKHYRVGAPWLYLSAYRDAKANEEIKQQRLSSKEVIGLDQPSIPAEDKLAADHGCGCLEKGDDRLFSACLKARRDFSVDPYGQMTFCGFIKDPALLYDLRKGTVEDCWENFIPSLADKIRGGQEYLENCGSCDLKSDCRWCPVYGYLEYGRFSAKVEHLCEVAKEKMKYKENWIKNHRTFYQIAGITIQIDSDIPIKEETIHSKLNPFKVDGPGKDTIYLNHHFSLPDLAGKDLGKRIYSKTPWSIYKKDDSWIYLGISATKGEKRLHRVAIFNKDHTRASIYHADDNMIKKGNLTSLTLFPTDQILVGRILADRDGCYMHSCGIVLDGKGYLFVGHSEAGKSTTSLMMKKQGGKILCDDRIIIRKKPEGFRIYGTWSHGDVPDISPDSAPLHAILFLKQSEENVLIPMYDKLEVVRRLLACLIKPFACADWWEKELTLIEKIAKEIPCHRMLFDKSGEIVEQIRVM